MNIFYLDHDPVKAARYHCDKHVVKMILETAQLLSTAHRVIDGDEGADRLGLYKATHRNHPSAIWVREAAGNYIWAHQLLIALCTEYSLRYGDKVHKTTSLLSPLAGPPAGIPTDPWITPVRLAMPDEYRGSDPVASYRAYYRGGKADMARWQHGLTPDWYA